MIVTYTSNQRYLLVGNNFNLPCHSTQLHTTTDRATQNQFIMLSPCIIFPHNPRSVYTGLYSCMCKRVYVDIKFHPWQPHAVYANETLITPTLSLYLFTFTSLQYCASSIIYCLEMNKKIALLHKRNVTMFNP